MDKDYLCLTENKESQETVLMKYNSISIAHTHTHTHTQKISLKLELFCIHIILTSVPPEEGLGLRIKPFSIVNWP